MVIAAVTATIRTECRLSMPGLLSGLAQGGQQNGDQNHGGNQENVLSKDQKAYHSGDNANDGGKVIFGTEPLLHKNRHKEGSQDKVDAFIVQGDQGTHQTAQHRSGHPVNLVEEGNQEAVAMTADAFRHLVLRNQRIGFVRKGENQVGLLPACTLVGIHHGDAVKQVAGIDHQGGQGCEQKTGTAGHQADSHILHGTGIDKPAHGQGPENTVSAFVQQNAKTEAQKQVSCHYRNRVQKRGANCLLFHVY